jgi:hypothetical protein
VRVFGSVWKVILDLCPQVQISMRLPFALVMIWLACWLAWQALEINALYGETQGANEASRHIFARVSMVCDAIAFIMPTTAGYLWVDGHRLSALALWVFLAFLIGVATLASLGFAAINISDSGAGRTQAVIERKSLESQIESLRKKQTEILGRPSRTQAQVNANKAAADNVQTELSDVETKLRALPAVSDDDPQANLGAKLVAFWTHDLASLGPEAFKMFRVTGLTLLPQLAGLFLMCGEKVLRGGRR